MMNTGMSQLHKFLGLPVQEKLLLAEAAVYVAVSRVAVRRRKRERVWAPIALPIPCAGVADAARVAWAVGVVSAWVPGATCLTQALAGREMLRKRRVESEIRVGVANANGFQAHAWLVADGRILLGGQSAGGYAELGRLP